MHILMTFQLLLTGDQKHGYRGELNATKVPNWNQYSGEDPNLVVPTKLIQQDFGDCFAELLRTTTITKSGLMNARMSQKLLISRKDFEKFQMSGLERQIQRSNWLTAGRLKKQTLYAFQGGLKLL